MSDVTDILRRVQVIKDRGSIRQQAQTIRTLLQVVESYVVEVREEEQLLKALPRFEAKQRQLLRSEDEKDREELQELEQTINEIKDKRLVVEQKIRSLRELSGLAQQLANLLR
jgi:hypothetical protein